MDIIESLELDHKRTQLRKFRGYVQAARVAAYVLTATYVWNVALAFALDVSPEYRSMVLIGSSIQIALTVGLALLSHRFALVSLLLLTIYNAINFATSINHIISITNQLFVLANMACYLVIVWGLLYAGDYDKMRRQLKKTERTHAKNGALIESNDDQSQTR